MHDNQINNGEMGNVPAKSGRVDGDELREAVLARLPDLDEDRQEPLENTAPQYGGRLLSAGLSKKLLVGCALAIVAVAVVPLLLKPEDWKTRVPDPEADAAPAWSPETAQTGAEGMATQSVDSGAVPQPNMPELPTQDAGSEGGLNIEMPAIPTDLGMTPSAHPNQAKSLAGIVPRDVSPEDFQHRSNRPMEIPLTPGVARLNGTIEKISHRPTYDQPQSGVY